jgi:hypothetical protein
MNAPQSRLDIKADELKALLGEIELDVTTERLTLSQLMREGTRVTGHAKGAYHSTSCDEDGEEEENTCGLASAYVALKAHGLVE